MSMGLALVTGGSRGYGACVARHLAGAGAKVAVLGREVGASTEIAEQIDGVPLVADVLDRPRIDRVVRELVDEHGPVDVLVNNAGVSGTFGLAWEVPADEWWHPIEVHVRGTHNVTSAVVPSMLKAGHGRIINIVSNAGTARWPYGSGYAVSKAALIKYGENLAAELQRRNVTVLNFNPGIMEIGLTETLFESEPEAGTVDRMIADWFHKQIDEGRSIDADDSASQLLRLARGDADPLTGRYLTAYDNLDEILTHTNQITASPLYTLGLLQPE